MIYHSILQMRKGNIFTDDSVIYTVGKSVNETRRIM